MNKRRYQHLFLIATVLILFLTDLATLHPALSIQEVQAGFPGLNIIVGLGNLISATNRRNRIYNEARTTQQDFNAYYDSLIASAQEQLQDRELMGEVKLMGEANRNQLQVYIKLNQILKAEYAAVTSQIEAEKNKARQQFNHALVREVTGFLIKSPGGQKIIRNVRETMGGLREAALAVQTALQENKPTTVINALVDKYTQKMNLLPGIRNEVRNLGSSLGSKLDQAMGGLLSQTEEAIDKMTGELGEAIRLTNELDSFAASAQNVERTPVSLIEEGTLLSNIHGVDRVNAGFDVAVQAYTNAAIIAGVVSGADTSKDNMQDTIRQQLLEQHTTKLAQAAESMSLVKCSGVGQAQYQLAAAQLGITPAKPRDPDKAAYIVCIDNETGLPVHAALIGPEAEETESEETVVEENEAGEEPGAEGETAIIPVGDYKGTTNYPDIYYENSPGHYLENTIEIHVAENGTVTGEMNVERIGDPDPSPTSNYPNCVFLWSYTIRSTISGHLTDSVGAITFQTDSHLDFQARNCLDSDPMTYDDYSEYTIEVVVAGNRMTGDTGDFAFEATRE